MGDMADWHLDNMFFECEYCGTTHDTQEQIEECEILMAGIFE